MSTPFMWSSLLLLVLLLLLHLLLLFLICRTSGVFAALHSDMRCLRGQKLLGTFHLATALWPHAACNVQHTRTHTHSRLADKDDEDATSCKLRVL